MVKGVYKGDINRDIDLFEKSLCLKTNDRNLEGINTVFPNLLEEISVAPSISYIHERMDRFIKVEQYLRHLLSVLYPDRYKRMPRDEENGLNFTEWTLAPLLKQAFNIVPVEYNLSTKKPYNLNFAQKDSYNLVYDTRNHSAHDFVNMNMITTFETVTAFLVVYLDIAGRLGPQIEEAFSREGINNSFVANDFCREIVNSYKAETLNGFSYVDIKWKSSISGETEYSTVATIMNDNENRLIKILGEAGCGKTTILKQLEYLTAKNYINKKSEIIPVFIKLGNTETDFSPCSNIKDMICNRLNISLDILEEMLSVNSLRLYLDGFNEILDIKLQKHIAWSIDELSQQYPELTIFLSDRSLVRPVIDTMRTAIVYRLYPLDNEMKKIFINSNCSDNEAKEIMLNCFDETPGFYENFNIPIKLKQLIELVSKQKTMPYDFDGDYIRFLFDREMYDKNDENVEYLEAFACALALSNDEMMSEHKAEACLAKCKQVLGYTLPDSRRCLRLMIEMGILSNEDGYIGFKYSSFRDYFWMRAFDKHLDELLGE